ncbi:transmembrane protein 266 [Pelecanus crispus]|uniref:transmembrane protein 266 n=1 Tax=Pelecanus crispus TaxID=36300 RepID=UPI003F5CFEC6
MTNPQPTIEGSVSEVEIISQQVEEETKSIAPVQLVNFAYRDLPLAALDLSVAGSQLLSNLDEEYQREGKNTKMSFISNTDAFISVKVFIILNSQGDLPSEVQICLVQTRLGKSYGSSSGCDLVLCTNRGRIEKAKPSLELPLVKTSQWATILRIVVLGIWDYIENKIEVFDGAVIILSLAPMVASTVANGPSSPWDAISLIITLRIWRVKRIIDAYVLPVKVEMEMMIQQYEKAKVIQDEQLERLTQICQEQGFEIRQLRAHLAQQDLDLAAEREAALQVPHVLNKQSSNRYKVVASEDSDDEATENITELRPAREDDMNNYMSRYHNEPSSDSGIPEAAICMVTTAAIDVHRPNISSDLFTVEVPMRLGSTGTSASITSGSASRSTVSSGTQACSESSQTLGSSPDCSTACDDAAEAGASPRADLVPTRQRAAHAMVQELLSSLSEEACLAQKGLDPVNLKLPSPAGSVGASPNLGHHRLSVYNHRNQESLNVFQLKPLIDCPQGAPTIDEKYGALGPQEPRLGRVPEV